MGFQPSQEYIDRLRNSTPPLEARFHGYTESEWKCFTKTQRRIITFMIELQKRGFSDGDMKKNLRKVFEISPSCMRSHLCNIKKKARVIKRDRVLAGTPIDDIKPREEFRR